MYNSGGGGTGPQWVALGHASVGVRLGRGHSQGKRSGLPVPPTPLPRPHPGGHTPRPDELLQHGCHLLWAHVAQAANGDGWNGRGTRQATCNPEWPRDGTWRGLWYEAPSPAPRAPREQLLQPAWAPKHGPAWVSSQVSPRPAFFLGFSQNPFLGGTRHPSWFLSWLPSQCRAPSPRGRQGAVAQAWHPPVFSSSVLGVLGLLMISTRLLRTICT